MGVPRVDEQGRAYLDSLMLPRALFSDAVAPPLRELILRMLAIPPEERITPAELAPALEQAADALSPLSPRAPAPEPVPAAEPDGALPARSSAPVHAWRPWLALAVATGALGLWAGGLIREALPPAREVPPRAAQAAHSRPTPGAPETGTAGLGEAAAEAPPEQPSPSASELAVADPLPELSEGQAQPDKKGRCPHPQQVVLNGGCWGRMKVSREECEIFDGQMYQQACYVPIFPGKRGRPSTSGAGRPRPQ